MNAATVELNRSLILSAMAAIEAWDRWIGIVPTGPAQAANQSLIRLLKGCIKAWRLWLIEHGQSQLNTAGSPSRPPSETQIKGV
jgi:hypothetical protein